MFFNCCSGSNNYFYVCVKIDFLANWLVFPEYGCICLVLSNVFVFLFLVVIPNVAVFVRLYACVCVCVCENEID